MFISQHRIVSRACRGGSLFPARWLQQPKRYALISQGTRFRQNNLLCLVFRPLCLETVRAKAKKLKRWLVEHEDKLGKTGKPKKSNLTDNDSAKMSTSHGVIQGYDAVAVVDATTQVVVHAEAYGEAQEHDLLVPMVQGRRARFEAMGKERDIFKRTVLWRGSRSKTFRSPKPSRMVSVRRAKGCIAVLDTA